MATTKAVAELFYVVLVAFTPNGSFTKDSGIKTFPDLAECIKVSDEFAKKYKLPYKDCEEVK